LKISTGRIRGLIYVAVIIGLVALSWFVITLALQTDQPASVVRGTSMYPTLHDGDLVILEGTPFSQLHVGDIIVFRAPYYHNSSCTGSPQDIYPCYIIHRIVKIVDSNGLENITTQGDNNNGESFGGIDYPVYQSDYVGRVILRVPFLGYVASVASPPYNYVIIGLLVVIILITEMYPSETDDGTEGKGRSSARAEAKQSTNLLHFI
jgi:signal peptidase I